MKLNRKMPSSNMFQDLCRCHTKRKFEVWWDSNQSCPILVWHINKYFGFFSEMLGLDYLTCLKWPFEVNFFGSSWPWKVTVSRSNKPTPRFWENHKYLFAGLFVVLADHIFLSNRNRQVDRCMVPAVLGKIKANLYIISESASPGQMRPTFGLTMT